MLGLSWRSCYLIAGVPGFALGIALMAIKDVRIAHKSINAGNKKMEAAEGSQEEMKSLADSSADCEIRESGVGKVKQIVAAFSTLTMILLFVGAAFRHSGYYLFGDCY